MVAAFLCVIIGGLAYLYYLVQLLIIAFQEHVLLGVLCLVIQVPLLFLVIVRWDRAGGSFLRALASAAFGLGGFFLFGTMYDT